MKCCNPVRIFKHPEMGLLPSHMRKYISVPCGKCYGCKMNKRQEWVFRCTQEFYNSIGACFVTLTYSDDNLPLTNNYNPTLVLNDYQLFLKRLRYYLNEYYEKKGINNYPPLRYVICGEYGGVTKRPHYHAILFNLPHSLNKEIANIWQLGMVKVGTCTIESISYVVSYLSKDFCNDLEDDQLRPFMRCSRNPGIGNCFINEENKLFYRKGHKNEVVNFKFNEKVDDKVRLYVYSSEKKGKRPSKMAMPRYYKEKFFSQDERREFSRQYDFQQKKLFERAAQIWCEKGYNEYIKFLKSNNLYTPFDLQETYERKKAKAVLNRRKL